MTVTVTQPSINVREKLAELDKPSGVAGEAMLRAETPQEQFNLIGAGRRNLIINGDVQVSQRGDYSSATASSHNTYTVDRWKTTSVGVNSTVQRQSVTLPNGWETNSTKIAASTTASSGSYIGQNQTIEDGQRILRSGGTWTVSAWIKTNRNDVVIRLGGVKNVGDPVVGDGQWHYYSATFDYTTSGSSDQGLGFLTYDNAATAITTGDYIEMAQFQLELGKVATPFEHRSYGEELALCQRFYTRMGNDDGGFTHLMVGSAEGASIYVLSRTLPTGMRAVPSVTLGSGVRAFTASAGVGTVNSFNTRCTRDIACISANISTTATTGQAAVLYDSGANGYIEYDSEL